jgi:phosphohistidine phosphatase
MLKRLTLLRHAKSSWKDGDLADIDRPLNKRGESDAPMMGRRLLARGARPSMILTSPAKRARRTARLIAREIGYPIEFLQREDELYLADPDTILAVLARLENSFNDVIVCGHNPGLTELANRLTGAGIDNIPTCGLVAMEADVRDWSALARGHCNLVFFDYPRLRGESDAG